MKIIQTEIYGNDILIVSNLNQATTKAHAATLNDMCSSEYANEYYMAVSADYELFERDT